MAECDVTAKLLRTLFHYDPATGIFTNRVARKRARPGQPAGCLVKTGYVMIGIGGRLYRAHRLAWLYMTGEWPSERLDHKNRIRSDNRFCNLREVTNAKNMQNVATPHADNATGFLGVSRHGSGFRAQIMSEGRYVSLGTFRTAELASQAYWRAKEMLHAGAITD